VGRRCSGNGGEAIGGGVVGGLESVGAAGLADVAERVISECLVGSRAAVGAGDADQIVVGIVAGLGVGAVELVGDGKLAESAVGVPSQISSQGLRSGANVELELGHAQGVRVVGKDVVVAGPEVNLCGQAGGVEGDPGDRILSGASGDLSDTAFA